MSHTKEPMFQYEFSQLARYENGRTPVLLTEEQYNRARACVNTCAGISTESLEQGGVGSILSIGLSELKRGDVAEKQRDELESVVRNQSQNIAHLNDQLAGLRSDKAMLEIQRDELLAALDSMVNSYQRIKPLGYPKCDSEKQADEAIANAKGSAS